MAQRRPTMMDPPIENLLDKVDSKFTLVTLAAKRARQVKEGGMRLVETPSGNPLSVALAEIEAGKIDAEYVTETEEG